MNCLTTAWTAHAPELRGWLRHRTNNAALADDLLQDLFLKALRQGNRFCDLQNTRAWLFEVARNLLADQLRVAHHMGDLPEDLIAHTEDIDTVDTLSVCLPHVLSELSSEDREAITLCDLHGMAQADFAQAKGLSLSAAKSRVQRARVRLRTQMSQTCQVQIDEFGKVADFVPRPPLAG
jgi:RNA polymerase sigma-70 factor (ECF subfamily)